MPTAGAKSPIRNRRSFRPDGSEADPSPGRRMRWRKPCAPISRHSPARCRRNLWAISSRCDVQHSFADGNFGLKLLAHTLIIAAFDPDAYESLPEAPMRLRAAHLAHRLGSRPPGHEHALELDTHLQKQRRRLQRHGQTVGYTPEMIRTGSPVSVTRCLLPRSTMTALGRARREFYRAKRRSRSIR